VFAGPAFRPGLGKSGCDDNQSLDSFFATLANDFFYGFLGNNDNGQVNRIRNIQNGGVGFYGVNDLGGWIDRKYLSVEFIHQEFVQNFTSDTAFSAGCTDNGHRAGSEYVI